MKLNELQLGKKENINHNELANELKHNILQLIHDNNNSWK